MNKVSITRSKLDSLAVAVSEKSGATLPLTIAQMQTAVEGISTGGAIYQDEDGYIVISDEDGSTSTLITKTITQNGTYDAEDDNASGYSSVTVNVSGGGGSAEEKQINFIDYDGTILHSYTKAEIQAMTAESDLPANPSHTGLTAQGWNWTLAQIKAQLTAMPDVSVWVGQMYITQSGDTELDCEFPEGRLSPILTIAVNGTVEVDWGDNTTADTVTGTSLTTRQAPTHTYASAGAYTIKIHVVSGSFTFYGSSSYLILRKNTTANTSRVYVNCIKAVRFGSGITSIKNYAFYYCSSLTSVTIPSGVTSIGQHVFNDCYSLTSVTIPNTVTSIEGSTFTNCFSLASVTIPNTVTSIGNNAFNYCYSLTSVAIPNTVTSIGSSAFNSCYSLASVIIPNTVTSIGNNVFYNCYSLASVIIPSGVTSIGDNAFYNCYSLTSVTIPNTVTSIGDNAFNGCFSLASITIPSGVTSIGVSAFNGCYSLASVTIPNTVTSIGNNVFQYCYSLASVIIPSGVTSIGSNVFNSCYGMAEYHFLATTPPTLDTSAFNNIQSDCIIYVPSSAVNTYKTATNWSTYTSYIRGE